MHIKAENINKNIAGNSIFEQFTVEVKQGERVAIIGRNGCGKTTLLQLLAGIEPVDSGRIIKKKDATMGYLHQIPHYPNKTGRDVLCEAFTSLLAMKNELAKLEEHMQGTRVVETTLIRYGDLQEKFLQSGGYEMDTELLRVSQGLGIMDLLDKEFENLSGGEQTKVMLGQILLMKPEILLLDEPTNHLDMHAIFWLEQYIQTYTGTVIVVSHDRHFLNVIATRIIEIEEGEAISYPGNYDAFTVEKEARILREFAQFDEQQKKIKKMKEAIKRLKQWANEANPPNAGLHRQAKNMEKALARIELVKKPVTAKKMNLRLNVAERSGKDVLKFEDVKKSYKQLLLKDASFTVFWKDRLAIVGENGCGKSTLLKMVLGDEPVDEGTITVGSNVQIGYLSQTFTYKKADARLIDVFRDEVAVPEEEARHILAQFMFYGYDVFKRVQDLSGGEKMRLRLAQLMHSNMNLLLLDEPTNHLDIESREVLEDTLRTFGGTIIAVSHDRYFLQQLFTKIAWIENQNVTIYHDLYDHVLTMREKEIKENLNNKVEKPRRERITVRNIEIEISDLEKQMRELQVSMDAETDWKLYEQQQLAYVQFEKQLKALYEVWLDQ